MKKVCVDFDGVVHSYTSAWVDVDVIPDPPVKGAFKWIEALQDDGLHVCIYSARSRDIDGIDAMRAWFEEHGMSEAVLKKLSFPAKKPPATLYIDDRGFCFEGTFPPPEWIREFKPWNRR